MPWFLRVCSTGLKFENYVGKGEIARKEQFLLFPQPFLPFQRTFHSLYQLQNCRLQTPSVWEKSKICRFGKGYTYKTSHHNLWIHKIHLFNSLPNNIFLDSSELKEFADDNLKFDENGKEFYNRVENTVGQGEIDRYEQFLLFPPCFQKTYTAET